MCPRTSAPDPAPSGPALAGRRVLVVEDECFLADDIARALAGLGAETVGPVPTREQALAHLEGGGRIDVCVLDLDLRGEMAFPVADALLARGVPFVFSTGYDQAVVPVGYAGVPRWEHVRRHGRPGSGSAAACSAAPGT